MTTLTTRYGITKPAGTDLVRSGDDHIRTAMDRIDLMMGEHGQTNLAPSGSDVVTSVNINYSRAYPAIPRVFLTLASAVGSATTVHVWPTNETVNGFTLNMRATNASARNVNWMARP